MSVIINEVEIEMAPPPEAASEAAEPPGPPAAPPTPLELRDIVRHLDERRARLEAH